MELYNEDFDKNNETSKKTLQFLFLCSKDPDFFKKELVIVLNRFEFKNYYGFWSKYPVKNSFISSYSNKGICSITCHNFPYTRNRLFIIHYYTFNSKWIEYLPVKYKNDWDP